jgi:tRNA pseudouridine38-40 synthase
VAQQQAVPVLGVVRIALGIAYDGTGFHGFAAQPGGRTVAGVLAEALALVLSLPEPPQLTCAGRTDAGVHALGQVAHLDVPEERLARWVQRHEASPALEEASAELLGPGLPATGSVGPALPEMGVPGMGLPGLARTLTKRLGPEVGVWTAAVAPGFDARRTAATRRYRYDVEPARRTDPLRARVAWQLDGPLDLAPMRLGCDPLVGEHDFAAFCRRPPDRPSGPILRRVVEARWLVLSGEDLDGELLRFEIEAVAFCHQMVRSIVGLLVAIGQGRARPSDVADRLASGSRVGNPPVAPPHGLCLTRVGYPEPWTSFAGPSGPPGPRGK